MSTTIRKRRKTTVQKVRKSWTKLDIETILLLWHLGRGGLDTDEIARITGLSLHGRALLGLTDKIEGLIKGPIPVCEGLRCLSCGAKLVQVPCATCKDSGYKIVPEKQNETS